MTFQNNSDDKNLKLSYWIVSHKILLIKLGIFIIILFNVLIFSISIFIFSKLYIFEYQNYKNNLNILSNTSQILKTLRPYGKNDIKQLNLEGTFVFDNNGKYDFLALFTNPNPNYMANFEYRFVTIAGNTDWKKSFILPGSQKYLYHFSFESEQPLSDTQVEFRNFKWKRIVKYNEFAKEHLNFNFTNKEFLQNLENEKINAKIKFTIQNNSVFSFKELGLLILFENNSEIVAADYIKKQNILANKQYPVEISIYKDIGNASQFLIVPDVNILDQNLYIEPVK